MAPPPPAPKLQIIKAKKPMKPFQWEKLADHIAVSSVWNDLANDAYSKKDIVEEEELLELFAKVDESRQIAAPAKVKETKKVVTLIDGKRAQDMAITIKGLRLPLPTINAAILAVDDKEISIDQLAKLSKIVPTSDEIEAVRAYEGDRSELGDAETFVSHLLDIPRVTTRVSSMIFRRRFDEEINEIAADLKMVREASEQVMTSPLLKQLLESVLVIGNYLNGTSFRGNARGFRIRSLLALKDTRANAGNSRSVDTLLHYVVLYVEKRHPQALSFMSDMPAVESAARISVSSLQQSVQKLRTGWNEVSAELEAYKAEGYPKSAADRFLPTFEKFLTESKGPREQTEAMVEEVQSKLGAMFKHFAEDDKDLVESPEKFFDIFTTFARTLQRAHKENDAVKRATETKKRLQARAEASKAGKELARLKTKIRGQTVRRGPGRDPSPLRASSDGATPAAPASGDAAPPAPTPSAAERLMATIAASDLPTLPDTAVMTASERLRFESAPKSTFMSLLPPPAEGIRMLKPVEGEAAFLSRLTVRRKKPTINLLDTSIDDIADSLLKQAAKESSGIASQAISEESLGSPTESLQSSVLTLDADLDAEVDGVPLAGADDAAEPASDGADRTAGPAGVESPPELDVGTLDEPKGGLAVSSMLLRVGSLATARKTMRRVRKQFSPELTRRMAELSAEDEATEAEPALIDPAAAESAADQPPADEPGVADGPAEDAAAKGDVAE